MPYNVAFLAVAFQFGDVLIYATENTYCWECVYFKAYKTKENVSLKTVFKI